MVKTYSNTTNNPPTSADENRLPCRGCTTSCKDYAICNGKPWRLPASSSSTNK